MTPEQLKEAVEAALDNKLEAFFIERKQHFEDHRFVQRVRTNIDKIRDGSLVALGCAIFGGLYYALKQWIHS